VLAGLVDATVMVGTAGRATRRNLHGAVEVLRHVSAPLVGAVLNGTVEDGGYGYGYSESTSPAPFRRWRPEATRGERTKARL
jgi:Mrp family chromosome partitioning ATPase